MSTESVPAPENNGLRSEIKAALNRASAENASDTPDHILADYLLGCLAAFDAAVNARRDWHSTENTRDWVDQIAPSA